jgi:hypothetical protein
VAGFGDNFAQIEMKKKQNNEIQSPIQKDGSKTCNTAPWYNNQSLHINTVVTTEGHSNGAAGYDL